MEVLLEARKKAGLTQEQVAQRVGIVLSYYRALEKGEQRNPSIQIVVQLARTLKVPAIKLIAAFLPKGHS